MGVGIVLDIMLPKLNGFQVCAKLREAGIWTPILMLTAKHGELDEAEALDTGADDYLTKPFSYVVLVAHVRALVRRGAVERPTVLTSGDLTIDPAARTCHRGRLLLDLTSKELAIVEFLAAMGRRRFEGGDPRTCVGLRLRRRSERDRGTHLQHPPQDRQAVRHQQLAHRSRRRLSPRRRRSLSSCDVVSASAHASPCSPP